MGDMVRDGAWKETGAQLEMKGTERGGGTVRDEEAWPEVQKHSQKGHGQKLGGIKRNRGLSQTWLILTDEGVLRGPEMSF